MNLRHALISGAILVGALSIARPSSGAESWTGWLGPQRDGWVADFQPPEKWPEKLAKDWELDVGAGYGTPLVTGDRVYQHARQGEDEVLW